MYDDELELSHHRPSQDQQPFMDYIYFYDGMKRRKLQTCVSIQDLGVDLTLTVWNHLHILAAVLLAFFFSLANNFILYLLMINSHTT